jgi:predicted amidophosphoribosyltransferase
MPTVAELSAPYGNFMLGPRRGPDVCSACFNLTDGYGRCYACVHGGRHLDAMAAISYSVAGEQLHHALASYKRLSGAGARQFALGLAAVLWRHLAGHERCLARAAGTDAFTLVTTVPPSQRDRAETHPLHLLVAELVRPARERYARVLERSDVLVDPHRFSDEKYTCRHDLAGRSVLLVDDTWTTGANAQGAAAALRAAGAGAVGALVIGRFVNRGWHHNDRHLRSLTQPFDWNCCALCGEEKVTIRSCGARV